MREHLLEYIDTAKSGTVRGIRILVEYFYALEVFEGIKKSGLNVVSVFGSARLKPGDEEYIRAKKLGQLLYENGFAVVTGASRGIMAAANEGVVDGIVKKFKETGHFKDVDAIQKSREYKKILDNYSLGLKITLPFEAENNPYLGVVATFHYFMVRKFFFASLSSAFIACEGGWGTRDELFEILTLVQTGKAPLMPIIYISPDPKHLTDDIDYAIKKGYISAEDTNLLEIVSDYKKAVLIIKRFYDVVKSISYDKEHSIEITTHRALSKDQQLRVRELAEKKFAAIFTKGVTFTAGKFELKGFNYKSYGYVRKIIDAL